MALKTLENYSAFGGHEPPASWFWGQAHAEQGGSQRTCYLPTEPKLPSDCRSFPFLFSFFFNFLPSFSFFFNVASKIKGEKSA